MAYYRHTFRRSYSSASSRASSRSELMWHEDYNLWSLKFGKLDGKIFKQALFWLKAKHNLLFNAETNLWFFEASELAGVKEVLNSYHISFFITEGFKSEQALVIPESNVDYLASFCAITGLSPSNLTLDKAKLAYRNKAKTLHPDVHGDADKMSELNVAWGHVQKQLA